MSRVDETVDTVQSLGRDIGSHIREQRRNAEISLRELARLAGVSNPYLSQIERGVRHPSATVLSQIAKGLRISAEALYVHAGLLEEHAAGPVVEAIAGDPTLSERQKQVLLEIYRSFRREDGPGGNGQQPAGSAYEPPNNDNETPRSGPTDGSSIKE